MNERERAMSDDGWNVHDLNGVPEDQPAFGPMSREAAEIMVARGAAAPVPRAYAAIPPTREDA